MFKHSEHKKRGLGLPFMIFRFLLSLVIFGLLLGGLYSAYRHFSGFDPIKLDPKSISSQLLSKDKLFDIVLGLFAVGDSKSDNSKNNSQISLDKIDQTTSQDNAEGAKTTPLFKFAVVSDSHNDNSLLAKALSQAQQRDVKFIIGLGDYTNVGTIEELKASKQVFDSTGTRYFVVPGDHDLWDSRNRKLPALTNFKDIFGKNYQSFEYQGIGFLLFDNSDDYLGLDETQLSWLKTELTKDSRPATTIALTHEPLYHPSSDHFMGKVTPSLKTQATQIQSLLKTAGVKEVFTGDIHFFTQYNEPETGIHMTTLGAVTQDRNPQSPRYAIVTLYEGGALTVEDIEI